MPPLLDLPNELLFKIIDHIHPDDLPNFSLTCKDIYHLAGDAVELHLHRQGFYEDVLLHGCHRHKNNKHPLDLIKKMCMDWKIGEYVKTLTFECCQPPSNPIMFPEHEDMEDIRKYEVERRKDNTKNRAIMPAILGYIKEKAPEWSLSSPTFFGVEALCEEAEKGERSAMLALLLLLFLPNLHTIHLFHYTCCALFLKHTIISMPEQHFQQHSRARTPFANLKYVGLWGSRYNLRSEHFEVLMWFAALPSVRNLYGHCVAALGEPEEEWTIPPHTSNVTHIYLSNSAVRFEYLEHLLLGIKSLESFSYEHDKEMMAGMGMKAHKIFTALLQHAKQSLKVLELLGGCRVRAKDEDVIDLQAFEVLKELRLNIWIYVELLPYRGDPANRRDREDFQPLVYALPSSIEILELTYPRSFGHVAALFVDFAEKKDLRLPNLHTINFHCGYIGNDEDWVPLREMCEQLGVTLAAYRD